MPEDIRLAALEQMVIRDRTVNEAFDLDLDIQWIETLLVENGLKQNWKRKKMKNRCRDPHSPPFISP
jgi:hypothetical protein